MTFRDTITQPALPVVVVALLGVAAVLGMLTVQNVVGGFPSTELGLGILLVGLAATSYGWKRKQDELDEVGRLVDETYENLYDDEPESGTQKTTIDLRNAAQSSDIVLASNDGGGNGRQPPQSPAPDSPQLVLPLEGVQRPSSAFGKNLHRHLTKGAPNVETLQERLREDFARVDRFAAVYELLVSLADELPPEPKDASTEELQAARRRFSDLSTKHGREGGDDPEIRSTLLAVADFTEGYRAAKQRNEQYEADIAAYEADVGKLNRAVYGTGVADPMSLDGLLTDAEAGVVGRRVAADAADDLSLDRVVSPTARDLLRTLADHEHTADEVEAALDAAVDDLNEHQIREGKLSGVSTRSELRSRIESLEDRCSAVDDYLTDEIRSRLREERSALDGELPALRRYGIQQRLSVFEDVVGLLATTGDDGISDVEAYRQEVASDLEEFRHTYITSDQNQQYSPVIPNHFANLTDRLLSDATKAHDRGEPDIARGFVKAAEATLDATERMYTKRDIRNQLVDIQRIRGPNYTMVETDNG